MRLNKAYEITDARIQFVSLVDKAANLKSFLITKADDGSAKFSTYGKIIAKDAEHHFLTGIVYEPLAEDAHGNFMTEEEITKAAYYFAKSGAKIDLQHSFEPLDSATVVESWIAKADFDVDGQTIKKGTWLMTVELTDEKLWAAVEKGEITGFSMGGVGKYSEEDTDLGNIDKASEGQPERERKGLFKRLAELFGFDVVEKGEVADLYNERTLGNQFWTAFYALQDVLYHWDGYTQTEWYETDDTKVREALEDFSKILTGVLSAGEPVKKTLAKDAPVLKVGKKLSGKNRETLQGIYDTLGTFIASFDEADDDTKKKPAEGDEEPEEGEETEKEEKDLSKADIEKMVAEAVTKAMAEAAAPAPTPAPSNEPVTAEAVQKMVDEAIKKALAPEEHEEPLTTEAVQKMVEEAVTKAVEPVLKARGVPSALNDNGSGEPVKKSEEHYLHGIL